MANYKLTLKKDQKITSMYFHYFSTSKTEKYIDTVNKPLVPYDPNHTRNKFIENFERNFSMVNIGNNRLIQKIKN